MQLHHTPQHKHLCYWHHRDSWCYKNLRSITKEPGAFIPRHQSLWNGSKLATKPIVSHKCSSAQTRTQCAATVCTIVPSGDCLQGAPIEVFLNLMKLVHDRRKERREVVWGLIILTAEGKPVNTKMPRIGAQKGLSGGNTPKIGFLLKYSNTEPTCSKCHAMSLIKIMAKPPWTRRKTMCIVENPKLLMGCHPCPPTRLQLESNCAICNNKSIRRDCQSPKCQNHPSIPQDSAIDCLLAGC